jgi:2-polyprenyl-3-methyl-5-hydroxy-6-metoxy-1,4-benzoquinol methylase
MAEIEKSTKEYWESTHSQPRWRLPSPLNVGTRNALHLLRRFVHPSMRVLEIGCAPGKYLAYLAKRRSAEVWGLDYSAPGIRLCRELFDNLHLQGSFVQENLLSTSLPGGFFDVVYSLGVIEHFDDPRHIVEQHLLLAKPGGLVLIAIPNYRGIYRYLQQQFDPDNLKIHNLDIMERTALSRLAPASMTAEVSAFPSGNFSPWLISFQKRWPAPMARAICHAMNLVGILQPFGIGALCPFLVLLIRRS